VAVYGSGDVGAFVAYSVADLLDRDAVALCTVSAAIARFGSSSERLDLGVLVSPLLLAERQTWTTPLSRST